LATELATAYVSLVPSFKGAQKSIATGLSAPAASAGTEAGRKFGVNFGNLAKRVIAGAAIYQGVSTAAGFAKEAIFGFNSTLQQSTIAFTTMLGSGKKAQTFLDQLQSFAKSTPFDFEGLVKNSQLMLGMGISAKDIIPDLTALGDSVASVGGDSSQLNSVILAFSQTMAKGTLDMGNMNQLLQGGMPTALKVLAASYGVTTGAMVKMISTGKVQSADALPRLVKGLEEGTSATAALGGMMDKQSTTFSGALGNIEDSLTQAVAGAFRPFFNTVSVGMQKFAEALSGPGFAKATTLLTKGLVAGLSLAGGAIKSLEPVAVRVFKQVLVPAFNAVVAVVPKLVTAVRNLWTVIEPLAADVATGLVAGFRAFLAVAQPLLSALAPITGWMKDNATLVRTLAVAIGTAVVAWKAYTIATAVWTGVTQAAAIAARAGGLAIAEMTLQQKIATAVTKVWTGVTAAFNAVMDANPIVLVAIAIAALAAGIIYAYTHCETFREIVQGVFGAVQTVVMGVVDWFTGSFIPFFTQTIPNAFTTMGTFIQTAFNTVVGFLKTWGPVALAVLVPFIGIPLLIWQHFSQIKGFLSNAFSAALSTVTGFVGRIVSEVGSIPGKIAGFAGQMVSAGANLMRSFWNGLKSLAGDAAGFVGGVIGDIGSGIKNALNDVLHLPWHLPQIRIGAFGHYATIGGQTIFPRLATGGLTSGPTMAMVGDNPSGHELVAPMDSPKTVGLLANALAQAQKTMTDRTSGESANETVRLLRKLIVATERQGQSFADALDGLAGSSRSSARGGRF